MLLSCHTKYLSQANAAKDLINLIYFLLYDINMPNPLDIVLNCIILFCLLTMAAVLAGSAIPIDPSHVTDPHINEIHDELSNQLTTGQDQQKEEEEEEEGEEGDNDADEEEQTEDMMKKMLVQQLVQEGVVASAKMAVKLAKWMRQNVVHKMQARLAKRATTSAMAKKLMKTSVAKLSKKMACRVAAIPVKLAMKAELGPIGIAWDIADLVNLVLDFWDPSGYNNWSPNVDINNIAKQVQLQAAQQAFAEGKEYPELLGPWFVDDNMWTEVYTRVQQRLMMNALMRLPKIKLEEYFEKMMLKAHEAHPNVDINELDQYIADSDDDGIFEGIIETHYHRLFCSSTPTCRDIILTKEINEAHRKAGTGYTFEVVKGFRRDSGNAFSNITEVGIALTEAGANLWNETHKPVWKERHDFFFDHNSVIAYRGWENGDRNKCNAKTNLYSVQYEPQDHDDYRRVFRVGDYPHFPCAPDAISCNKNGTSYAPYVTGEINDRSPRNDFYNTWSVPGGFEVTLYEHEEFKGATLKITGPKRGYATAHLCDYGWTAAASSAKVRRVAKRFAFDDIPIAMRTDTTITIDPTAKEFDAECGGPDCPGTAGGNDDNGGGTPWYHYIPMIWVYTKVAEVVSSESGDADDAKIAQPTKALEGFNIYFDDKVTFASYLGPVYSYCEKSRQYKSVVGSADPAAHGVRFDFSKGRCIGSEGWCTRVGMDWDQSKAEGNGDCYLNDAQEICEDWVLGTSTCRGAKRLGQTIGDGFKDLFG